MSRSSELSRVALLAATFGRAPGITVGIGDDAAVLEPAGAPLVWTIDAQVEGVHFRLDWLTWRAVGWRSFMAAASDVAAMGATPIAALSALVLADHVDDDALAALAAGQAEAAVAVGAPIVGGNLARGAEVSVTTTLLGRADRSILRGGARPGDGVYLAGAVGVAAAGLAALEGSVPLDPEVETCIDAWRRPRALIEHGLAMGAVATAAVDVSDGLSRDASRIAEASDVTLVLDEARLRALAPVAFEHMAVTIGRDVLELMLGGGEDYALLATSPSPIAGFERVGDVEPGPPRVVLARIDGARAAIDPTGFDHFG